MAEGSKLLAGALDAGASIESVFLGADADAAVRAQAEGAAQTGARVFDLAPGVLERVADTVTPQPVIAVVAMPSASLADLGHATFVVVCVDVRDPGNAGAVIRVADAAGADAVVCCHGTADPFGPKTVRASAGSVLHVPVVRAGDPAGVLHDLARVGLRRFGATSHGGVAYTGADLGSPLALVLGNEASGLPASLDHAIDTRITVPMVGRTESLNVSSAAAVLCFEVARSRSNLPAMETAP